MFITTTISCSWPYPFHVCNHNHFMFVTTTISCSWPYPFHVCNHNHFMLITTTINRLNYSVLCAGVNVTTGWSVTVFHAPWMRIARVEPNLYAVLTLDVNEPYHSLCGRLSAGTPVYVTEARDGSSTTECLITEGITRWFAFRPQRVSLASKRYHCFRPLLNS